MRLSIAVNGQDVSASTLIDLTEINKSSSDSISTATVVFVVKGVTAARYGQARYGQAVYNFAPKEWDEVVITDQNGTRQFAGYVTALQRQIQDQSTVLNISCTCSDYGILITRTVIDASYLTASDQAILLDAISNVSGVTASTASVALLQANLGTLEAKDQSVRDLIDSVCELTGGEWRVDYNRVFHYYAEGSTVAPFGLSDTPDKVTSFGYWMTEVTRDFSSAANRIVVLGAMGDGAIEVRATAESYQSQVQFGVLSQTVIDREITDTDTAQLRANAELAQRAFPLIAGKLTMWVDGLDVGQTVPIANQGYGISEGFLIREMRITQVSDTVSQYEVTFGQKIPDQVLILRRLQQAAQGPTRVPDAVVADGSLTVANFAQSIRPVQILNTLPAMPNTNYPQGSVVFLTADNKLYRSTGDTWTKAVTQGDLAANSVIAGTIAAGAIRAQDAVFANAAIQTADIADASITNAKIANASITNAKIASSSITGTQIQNSTITGTNISGSTITNANIADSTLTGAKIQDATITSAKIASLDVTKLTAGTITASVTMTAPALIITGSNYTLNIDQTNCILATSTFNDAKTRLAHTGVNVQRVSNTSYNANLSTGGVTVNGPSGYVSISNALGLVTVEVGDTTGNSIQFISGTAAASALPSTPSGYHLINVNGTQRKVPFY